MKCDVVKTRKGWTSWCKTHHQDQLVCLKEALAPFVKFITIYEAGDSRNGSVLHSDLPDDFAIYAHSSRAGEAIITLGDLRAAKKALEAL